MEPYPKAGAVLNSLRRLPDIMHNDNRKRPVSGGTVGRFDQAVGASDKNDVVLLCHAPEIKPKERRVT